MKEKRLSGRESETRQLPEEAVGSCTADGPLISPPPDCILGTALFIFVTQQPTWTQSPVALCISVLLMTTHFIKCRSSSERMHGILGLVLFF